MTTSTDKTLAVNSLSEQVEAKRSISTLTAALMGGTLAMRNAKQAYLPKWPAEDEDSYKDRLSKTTLFPAYRRTVMTLAAKPFSKPITVGEDVPSGIKALFDDIDLQGNNLDSFMSENFKLALADGLSGILVEHPKRPEGARTIKDEKDARLRPYFVRVNANQILGWRSAIVEGRVKLTMLRILESIEEPFGDFGVRTIDQVRVLEPGKWTTYRAGAADEGKTASWVQFDSGTTNLNEIPFVPIYGERVGFMDWRPPMLELAHLNVKHWQQQSDQDNLMHVARVPMLAVRGVDEKFKLVVGSANAVNLGDSPNAEMMFVEHTGAAINAGKVQLDDLREEMRQSGAELLVIKPGPTTATEVATDNAVGMCALQEMTMGAEDALDQACKFMADYMSLPEGGHSELFKDFAAATLAEASAQLLVGMATSGKLSDETLFSELKRRGIVSSDVDWDEEKGRLDAQGPALGSLLPGDPNDPNAKKPMPGAPAPAPKPPVGGSPVNLKPVVTTKKTAKA